MFTRDQNDFQSRHIDGKERRCRLESIYRFEGERETRKTRQTWGRGMERKMMLPFYTLK